MKRLKGRIEDGGPHLVSRRLSMRPIGAEDWVDYALIFNEVSTRFLDGPLSEQQRRDGAAGNERRWREVGAASWLADLRVEDGSIVRGVGLAGFSPPAEDGTIGYGWIVAPDFWRRGLASEMSYAQLDWFFEHFDATVRTYSRSDNVASVKASESLGFRFVSDDGKEHVREMARMQWLELRSASQ